MRNLLTTVFVNNEYTVLLLNNCTPQQLTIYIVICDFLMLFTSKYGMHLNNVICPALERNITFKLQGFYVDHITLYKGNS